MAERVLNRAIALHHDEVHGPDRITRKQLDQIAKELGIEPEFVQAALVAELETGNDADAHSIKALLLAPDRITGGRIVEADRSTVERSIIEWLRGEEGFRPRTKTGSGYKWERDDHWATKLRMSVGGSKPSLRGLKTVTHRRTDLGDGRHLVELDADAKVVSMTGAGIIAGFGAASVLGGVAAAAGIAGGNDLAQFLAAMVPTAATGLAAGLRCFTSCTSRPCSVSSFARAPRSRTYPKSSRSCCGSDQPSVDGFPVVASYWRLPWPH